MVSGKNGLPPGCSNDQRMKFRKAERYALIVFRSCRAKDKIHVKIAQAQTEFEGCKTIIIYVYTLVDIKNDRSANYDY